MAHFNPDDFSRFEKFDILNTTFKTVSGHPIEASILVPKNLTATNTPTAPRPIILRYHGGGFIGASRLFPDFFGPWLLDLAARESAIILSPDYRLLPEASADELLEDVEDFWKWVHADLQGFLREKTSGAVAADLSRILVSGESAGGYLSLMTALNHPAEVKSVTAAYPMVDLRSPHYTEAYEKPILGMQQLPASLIDDHREKVKSGELPSVISSDPRFERGGLMIAYFQHGRFDSDFPADRRDLQILSRLRDGARFPAGGVFVWHGKDDTVVPAEGSKKLEETLRELKADSNFKLTLRDGDHGFDGPTKLDEDWIAGGLMGPIKAWLD